MLNLASSKNVSFKQRGEFCNFLDGANRESSISAIQFLSKQTPKTEGVGFPGILNLVFSGAFRAGPIQWDNNMIILSSNSENMESMLCYPFGIVYDNTTVLRNYKTSLESLVSKKGENRVDVVPSPTIASHQNSEDIENQAVSAKSPTVNGDQYFSNTRAWVNREGKIFKDTRRWVNRKYESFAHSLSTFFSRSKDGIPDAREINESDRENRADSYLGVVRKTMAFG